MLFFVGNFIRVFFTLLFFPFSIERWKLLIECERARGISRTEEEKGLKKENDFF